MNTVRYTAIIFSLLCLLLLPACAAVRPLLSGVSVRPDVITPNADGVDDVARIAYSLGRSADLSIYVVD